MPNGVNAEDECSAVMRGLAFQKTARSSSSGRTVGESGFRLGILMAEGPKLAKTREML